MLPTTAGTHIWSLLWVYLLRWVPSYLPSTTHHSLPFSIRDTMKTNETDYHSRHCPSKRLCQNFIAIQTLRRDKLHITFSFCEFEAQCRIPDWSFDTFIRCKIVQVYQKTGNTWKRDHEWSLNWELCLRRSLRWLCVKEHVEC